MSEAFEEQLEVHGKSFLFAWSELHPPEEELGFHLCSASERALEAVRRARAGARRPAPLLWPRRVLKAARSELVRLERLAELPDLRKLQGEERPEPLALEQLRAAVLEAGHNVGEAREALRELAEPGTGCPDPESFWRSEEVFA